MKKLIALSLSTILCASVFSGCVADPLANAKDVVTDVGTISESFLTEYTDVDKTFYQELMAANPSDVILKTSDGSEIDVATFSYWLAYYLSNFETTMGGPMDWSIEWDEENTVGDVMKEYAGSSCAYYAAIQKIAEEYNIELPPEAIEECKEARIQGIKDIGANVWNQAITDGYLNKDEYTDAEKEIWVWDNGREVYAQELKAVGTTDAAINNISLITKLHEVVMNELYTGDGEFVPTQKDMDAYITENNIVPVRFIYLSSYDESFNEVNNSEKMNELLAEIKNAADPVAKFNELLETESQSDFTQYPNGYLATSSDFSVEIMNILKDLAVDEYTEVLKDDYGWYIFMRTTMDEEQLLTRYIDEKGSALLDSYLQDIEMEETELYKNLDVVKYAEKIKEYSNIALGIDADETVVNDDTAEETDIENEHATEPVSTDTDDTKDTTEEE